MAKESNISEIKCCPFCGEDHELELHIDENIVVCYECGRNFKVIEDNL